MTDTKNAASGGWVPTDTFGHRLLLARRELGLSQEEAARRCNLDDGSWSNWELGAMPRRLNETVAAIVKGLGCNRDWLMWGEVGGTRPNPGSRLLAA